MAQENGKRLESMTRSKDPVPDRRGFAGPKDKGDDGWFLATAAGIVVGALLLRLYHLGVQDLWVDEAFSWHMATTPNGLDLLLFRSTPPLHYLLIRGWVALAGQSEAMIRLPSAVAGTLFVAAAIWAGREIFDPPTGLWSGLVAAVSPIHVYYSQEGRSYALLTLILLLTHVLLWRALKTNTWQGWALVSAATLLALYTHYFAILGLLPGAFLVLIWPEPSRWPRYATANLLSGLLFLPWVVWSLLFTPHLLSPDWMQIAWARTPPLLAIPRSLEVFGLGSQAGLITTILKQFWNMQFPSVLRLLGVVILSLLGIWIAVPWGDQNVGLPWLGKRKAWLGLLLGFPLGALWLVSYFHTPVYVVGRYDLVAFPAFPLLLGLALRKTERVRGAGRALAPLAALVLLVPIAAKLFLYYQAPSSGEARTRGDARATAQLLHQSVEEGDVVVFTGLRGLPVLYYLSRLGYRWEERECRRTSTERRFTCRMYPREMELNPGAYDLRRVAHSVSAIRDDLQDFLRTLRPHRGTLWIAFGAGRVSEGRLQLPPVDTHLVEEVQRLGMGPVAIHGAPLVFRFQGS